jgi:hypothetical protein
MLLPSERTTSAFEEEKKTSVGSAQQFFRTERGSGGLK